jgi:drug/metabolite transporter (DMT)-like permease
MTSTAGPTFPVAGGRRRNLLDLTSQEWGRPKRQSRYRRPWVIVVGGLAFSGLGFALVVAARSRTTGGVSQFGRSSRP